MEQTLAILLNKAVQKFVKTAKCARENQLHGESSEEEFCHLTRLWSVIWVLQNSPESIDYEKFRELEKTVNQIGGRDEFIYKPIVTQPVEAPSKDCCDVVSDIIEQIGNIREIVNYVSPTLQLVPTVQPDVFEVGHGNIVSDIQWISNKKSLNGVRINLPNGTQNLSDNLSGTVNSVQINLLTASPVTRTVYGWYNDKQLYLGTHKLAEASLVYKSVWPCYYGKGPANAMDDPATRNQFIHSLEKSLDCPKCFDINLGEGEYFWYFFRYEGQKKQFKTQNGVISGSWKGTYENFRTASMIANGIAQEVEYGILRFDETGVQCFDLCVVNMYCDDVFEVELPNIPEPEPEPEEPEIVVETFDSTWTGYVCVKTEGGV